MALLDMCKRVMAETGWPQPVSIATNSDATAQQIFAIANTELVSLSEEFSWPQLEVEYTFTTILNQTTYLWPNDFRVLAPAAIFNADQYYRLKGSLPIDEWHIRKYGLLNNLSRRSYRVTYVLGVPALVLDSAPTPAEDLVAVYQTSQFARDQTLISIPRYMADTDNAKIPEPYIELGVKWRFRRAKGLDFSVELAEYNSRVRAQFSKYVATGEIPVGGSRFIDSGITPGYVRDNGFGQ